MSASFELTAKVQKVAHGVVFGWALISSENGVPYVDLHDDFVPDESVLAGAVSLADGARVAKEMHQGEPVGTVLFVWPHTADIAKAVGLEGSRTGLLIGMRPRADVLAKFQSGEYTGFSIGGSGRRTLVEEEDDA